MTATTSQIRVVRWVTRRIREKPAGPSAGECRRRRRRVPPSATSPVPRNPPAGGPSTPHHGPARMRGASRCSQDSAATEMMKLLSDEADKAGLVCDRLPFAPPWVLTAPRPPVAQCQLAPEMPARTAIAPIYSAHKSVCLDRHPLRGPAAAGWVRGPRRSRRKWYPRRPAVNRLVVRRVPAAGAVVPVRRDGRGRGARVLHHGHVQLVAAGKFATVILLLNDAMNRSAVSGSATSPMTSSTVATRSWTTRST